MNKTIEENIFTEIGKLLVLPTVLKNLKKAEQMLEDDVELQSYIESARYHLDIVNKKLPDFCKRHPESNLCKDTGKKDK
jgi:hypothetical protein